MAYDSSVALPAIDAQLAQRSSIHNVLLLSLPAVLEVGDDYLSDGHSFHLGLAYVASILREHGLSVKILDCYAEDSSNVRSVSDDGWQEIGLSNQRIIDYVRDFQPDLIGMSIPFSCQHYVAASVAQALKVALPDVAIVAGGNHVTAVPEELDRDLFDYLVIGEGEYAFLSLIQALNNHESTDLIPGVMGKNATSCLPAQPIKHLDDLPFPALELLPLKKLWGKGRRWINMVATRGCVFTCNFCSIHTVMGRRIRRRSVENVLAELKYWKQIYNIQEVYFEDDNLTAHKSWAKELFKRIAESKLNLRLYARNGIRADTVDKELLLLMKAAGFQDFMIAPESGSQRTLDEIIGKKMKLSDCTRTVELAREVNLGVNLFFVIGFPGETWEDIAQTIDYAKQLKQLGAKGVWMSLASPYPGTRMFKECQEKNLLAPDFDYRRCRTVDYQIINPNYTADELKAYRDQAMTQLACPRPSLNTAIKNGATLLLKDPSLFLSKLRYKVAQ